LRERGRRAERRGARERVDHAAGRANAWTTPHVLTISDGGDVTTLNPHLSTFASTANLRR